MREKYVLKNFIAKIFSTGLVTLLSFVSKKVFLDSLGDEVMGLNALLLSVLSMLSLLELGIGNAIYFSLYKPLAEDNKAEVSQIMRLYAKIYRVIGALVMMIGLILIPFLHFFVETDLSNRVLYSAYLIMLLDTALSYYMAYRRNIFNADQKEYFNTNVDTFISVATSCLQMLTVVLTKNYYLFLLVKLIGTLSGNLYIFYQSGQKYPYLKKKYSYQLPKEFMDTFIQNVKALCISNIASYLVFGTDNLLLSGFFNLTAVFIYSNYTAILSAVNQVFHQLFNSMQASVGNFMVVEGKEKTYELFKKIQFLNFLITGYTSVALLTLYNDAITLWMGQQYTWGLLTVVVLVFNNYSRYILQTTSIFRNAAGLYSPYPAFKFLSLFEGVVNILASLFFIVICKMGILGIFLGTSISTIVSTVAIPQCVYKYYFERSVRDYIWRYLQYIILTAVYCVLSVGIYHLIRTDMLILNLVFGVILSFAIPIGLSSVLYYKTEEFQFVRETVLRYLGKFYKKSEK